MVIFKVDKETNKFKVLKTHEYKGTDSIYSLQSSYCLILIKIPDGPFSDFVIFENPMEGKLTLMKVRIKRVFLKLNFTVVF